MPGAPRGRSSGGGGRRRHLLTRVLDAVREAGDARGCSAKQILNFLNSGSAAKEAVDKARLVMALKRGVQAGTLAYSGGRYKPGAKSTGWREICCRKRPAKWRARCRRMFSRPCRKIRRCRKKRRRSCRRRRRSCRRRRRSCRRRRRSCRRRRRSCRRKRRSCRRRRRPSCCPRRRRRRSCRRRRRRCSYDDPDLEAASMSAAKGGGGGAGSGNGGARSQQK